MLSGRIVGNNGLGTAFDEEASKCVAVVCCVCGEQQTWRQWRDEICGNGRVATLARRYLERDGAAATVDNSMDFCRSPAARAADRLDIGPPFPPAAERCALAVVLSIMWMSLDPFSASAANRRRQMPRADQR